MKTTAIEWDQIRAAFASSIMVDTAISSLAQNLDAPDWPIRAKDETPAKYIDLTLAEAVELLQLKGQAPERLDQLANILRETLAFDTPFGEMVAQSEQSATRENQLLKNLARLGIPEDFPIALTALSDGTQEFCKLEKLTTLGEFAVFAQGMSQNVIVGGDFKKLLNALSHIDEAALTEVLPFRRGGKGLHLPEALAQAAAAPNSAARAAAAVTWFKEEFAAIQQDLSAGGTLARHFVVLGNPAAEGRASALLQPHLPASAFKKPGFFSRLFGRK